jgi:CDGSH-type Zn-finger protein
MTKPAEGMRITVSHDGPYLVEGGVPLSQQVIRPDEGGDSWDWVEGPSIEAGESYRLCRCGGSRNKPFCDDTHERIHFDGTETASRAPYLEQAEVQPGPSRTLTDAEALCAFARFCDARGQIWSLVDQGGAEADALAERAAAHCPSGRLTIWRGTPGEVPPASEPDLPPSIGVVQDPAMEVSSGLWVRGGIPVVSADGTPYEVRNRVMLCRCGESENKPFCDGTHASIHFDDGGVAELIEPAES